MRLPVWMPVCLLIVSAAASPLTTGDAPVPAALQKKGVYCCVYGGLCTTKCDCAICVVSKTAGCICTVTCTNFGTPFDPNHGGGGSAGTTVSQCIPGRCDCDNTF
ncbi:hypothetical protein B0H66DRAFT_536845 [Apodospora peruviana]|uniref:Uncharacterized protein n=1 Tax=Apodospora peruviana TaxID=516989 RepID=A0AAE0HVM4_9PEZI|nr:hypothetical protein B0H66DRAFT_536845 [Apodospora peruviana]